MKLSFDDEESFKEAAGSLRFINPPSDSDTLRLQRMGSGSSMPHQEWDEDICFNNPQSDPNTLQRMGSSSSIPPQEKIGLTWTYWYFSSKHVIIAMTCHTTILSNLPKAAFLTIWLDFDCISPVSFRCALVQCICDAIQESSSCPPDHLQSAVYLRPCQDRQLIITAYAVIRSIFFFCDITFPPLLVFRLCLKFFNIRFVPRVCSFLIKTLSSHPMASMQLLTCIYRCRCPKKYSIA